MKKNSKKNLSAKEKSKIKYSVADYNFILRLNRKIGEVEKDKERIKTFPRKYLEVFHEEKVESPWIEEQIICSEDVNMPTTDDCGKEIVLDKMEIHSYVRKQLGCELFDLVLELYLCSEEKCFPFVIAKTEKCYKYYAVSSIEDLISIESGGGYSVIFASKSDFLKVVSFCDLAIFEFGKKLVGKKIHYHLEKYSKKWEK